MYACWCKLQTAKKRSVEPFEMAAKQSSRSVIASSNTQHFFHSISQLSSLSFSFAYLELSNLNSNFRCCCYCFSCNCQSRKKKKKWCAKVQKLAKSFSLSLSLFHFFCGTLTHSSPSHIRFNMHRALKEEKIKSSCRVGEKSSNHERRSFFSLSQV